MRHEYERLCDDYTKLRMQLDDSEALVAALVGALQGLAAQAADEAAVHRECLQEPSDERDIGYHDGYADACMGFARGAQRTLAAAEPPKGEPTPAPREPNPSLQRLAADTGLTIGPPLNGEREQVCGPVCMGWCLLGGGPCEAAPQAEPLSREAEFRARLVGPVSRAAPQAEEPTPDLLQALRAMVELAKKHGLDKLSSSWSTVAAADYIAAQPPTQEPTPDVRRLLVELCGLATAMRVASETEANAPQFHGHSPGISPGLVDDWADMLDDLGRRFAAQPPSPPRDERLPDGWRIEGGDAFGPTLGDCVNLSNGQVVMMNADTRVAVLVPTAVLRALLGMPPAIDEAAVRAKRVSSELMQQLEDATRASEREAIAAWLTEQSSKHSTMRPSLHDCAQRIRSGAYRQPAQGTEEGV